MLNFIFFGRTTYDKGIDLVLDIFLRLAKEGVGGRHIDIYGSGPLSNSCKQAATECASITYHGRSVQEIIHARLEQSDYCLMPSRVLETFGKSALESLSYGVPVIGFKKGGLAQFVDEEFSINDINPFESMFFLVSSLIKKSYKPSKDIIKTNIEPYTKDKRLHSIHQILGAQKKIVHISDFIRQIGGIETFLRESKNLLESDGYSVSLFGGMGKVSALNFLATACNIPAWYKLQKLYKKIQPDVVWFHSLLRYLGPIVLYGLPSNSRKIFTVHDLGYFHPYPSKIYGTENIPTFSLQGFIGCGKGIAQKRLIALKFLSLKLLQRRLLKIIDIRCVPSQYMVDILHTSRGVPKQKIVILPHFV